MIGSPDENRRATACRRSRLELAPQIVKRHVQHVRLHIILPHNLADDYLYTRVPMTLAHHVAMAFHAADLATGV